MLPLCFVLMPFGKKAIPSGATVDFDAVYEELIAPAIHAAGMEPLRADEEVTGGVIHKPMFCFCPTARSATGRQWSIWSHRCLRHWRTASWYGISWVLP